MNCVMESLLVVLQDRNFLKRIFTQSGVYLRNRKLRTQNVRERGKEKKHHIRLRYIVVFKEGSSGFGKIIFCTSFLLSDNETFPRQL